MDERIKEEKNKCVYGKISFSIENISEYRSFESFEEVAEWGQANYGEWAAKYRQIMQTAK